MFEWMALGTAWCVTACTWDGTGKIAASGSGALGGVRVVDSLR